MKTHYTHRTRCFILSKDDQGKYVFPMLKRNLNGRKLWQLPGGGIDQLCMDDINIAPSWRQIYDAQIAETKEELGIDISVLDGKLFSIAQVHEEYKEGNIDYAYWRQKGHDAQIISAHYYYMACVLPKRPEVVLGEPDKFLEIGWARMDSMYEDINSPQYNLHGIAPLAAGIEFAYCQLSNNTSIKTTMEVMQAKQSLTITE